MTVPRSSRIDAVIGRWGCAFIIFYARDRWLAMRRDDGLFMPAGTLDQLETEMDAELAKRPLDENSGDGRPHLAEYLGPELASRSAFPTPGSPARTTRTTATAGISMRTKSCC